MNPRVLDPCCGSRMFWFDHGNPDAVFGDRRRETITVTDHSHGNPSGKRSVVIDPDTLLDSRVGARGLFRRGRHLDCRGAVMGFIYEGTNHER